MRWWVDLTNEAQHGGTREVSLERTEEKSSVNRTDLFIFAQKRFMRILATRSSYVPEVYAKRFIVI